MKGGTNTREKVWLRLDRELLLKARDLARAEYEDEKKWRAVVEEALVEYFAKKINDVDLSSLLSKTERALFDRLYGKIEREFDDMAKRMTNRVGSLIAVSSYDVALTAIMVEELFKVNHSHLYSDARKLAASRMKKRWAKEGANEIQLVIEEKKEAENEVRNLRAQLQNLQKQANVQKQLIKKYQVALKKLQSDISQAEEVQEDYGQMVSWCRGLIEHLERSSILTNAKTALDQYEHENSRPSSL